MPPVKTTGISVALDDLVTEAETAGSCFLDFTLKLLKTEAAHRHRNEVKRRLKMACLPRNSDLNAYDYGFENGLKKTRLNQLRELHWMDQLFNLMLMGPSGTGKTFLAAGLCADVVDRRPFRLATALRKRSFMQNRLLEIAGNFRVLFP